MSTVLLTGATGFVGSHVLRALRRRGDDVRVTVRPTTRLERLGSVSVERVECDLLDPGAVARAVKGVDAVVHAAGLISFSPDDHGALFDHNVGATRTVMEAALAEGVERVVYVSAAMAVGRAEPNRAVDETALFDAGSLGITYVNAKREAEVQAMRLAAKGLPLVCVNPSWAMGPHDPRMRSQAWIRRFLTGRLPTYVGGGLNIVDVRDLARGVVAALRSGRVGERYLLGGRNFTTDRLLADLSRIAGVDPPARVPAPMAIAAVELAERTGIPSFSTVEEVRMSAQWWTYRSAKAQRELGFTARGHEETLEDTVAWMGPLLTERYGDPPNRILTQMARAMQATSRLRIR